MDRNILDSVAIFYAKMSSNRSQFYVMNNKIIVIVVLLRNGPAMNMPRHWNISTEEHRLPPHACLPSSGLGAACQAESELVHHHVVVGDQDLDGKDPQGSVPD